MILPDTLRNSGIPFIDDVPWSSHLCVFYETRADLIDAAARFFEQGLDNNELCVWALPECLPAHDAVPHLRQRMSEAGAHLEAGRLRFAAQDEWYRGEADADPIDDAWDMLIDDALSRGCDGVRISGDAVWQTQARRGDPPYEDVIARILAGRPALALSTYDLSASRGADVLDAARLFSLAVARRRGEWQPFETPSWRAASDLEAAFAAMASAFPGHQHLTGREQAVLELLLRGASSKDVARDLGISPRTAEFHRANIIGKLGARNTADVIRRVFSRR